MIHPFAKRVFCLVFVAALGDQGLHAQLVSDGATNTLSNVTNSFTGDVIAGTNGSFTLLVLSDNALLTNSLNGVIGRNATAKSNEVRLISASARWRMGNSLFVGSNGALSRLVVSNGALVENFDGVLANGIASSNNIALVTGGGSIWSNRGDLVVGHAGRENQLIVSNGGRVANRFGYLGRQSGSSSNLARVTGSGSVWNNQFDLAVGFNDRSNRLIIEAGGVVSCANGVVSSSSSSGNNEVLVTGPGSLWSNRFFLFMGDVAGRNRLVVSNGATVWSGGSILGTLSLALSNQVIVTGPGSVWTNESSLSLGESSPGNRVDVSDGGRLECSDGSLGQTLAGNNNTVFLTGSGSAWNNLANLIVGNSGSGNTLTASNGATISASNLFVGFTSSGVGNRVTVDGGTLRVTNAAGTGVLDVRRGAVSLRAGTVVADRLLITNAAGSFDLAGGTLITRGAAITNIGGFTVGGSTTNPAIWDVRAGTGVHALAVTLSVGSSDSFNQMLITNGGTLTSGVAYIGSNAGSRSNVALLSGPGSKWTAANLDVGNGGAFNRLIVSNGATVEDFNAALGQNTGSSNNLAVVTGAGSLWTNRNEMYVGYQGSGNQLVISHGGTAFALATRFLGHASGAVSNNTAIVTGAGSRWLGPGNLEVGGPAAFCQLLVTDGGLVENNSGFIGSGSSASNNLAVVTGAGSVWSNANSIFVGSSGVGNELVVSNAGKVFNVGVGNIGRNIGANSNTVTVTGAGTMWTVGGNFNVGSNGALNRLIISNGGQVFGQAAGISGSIGQGTSGSNNLAVVTGAGSLWSNAYSLYVGVNGRANQLVVSNGAMAHAEVSSFVGSNATSSNNVATVTDSGSLWNTDGALYFGFNGAGNRLVVSNGGAVEDAAGYMGVNSDSSNNVALVTGSGSSWSNSFELRVGYSGSGNQLVVSNGGVAFAEEFVNVGFNASSTNNRVTVDGGTLRAANATGKGVLDVRRGTNVLNAGLIDVDQLVMTNTQGFFEFNGGTLVTRGAIISNGTGFAIGNGGIPAVWDVRASPSNHVLAGSLIVGVSSPFNQLLITNGAVLTNSFDGFVGLGVGSSSNTALVAGSGSRWLMGSYLYVGYSDRFNRLIVTNGGFVAVGADSIIGGEAHGTNCEAIITGPGSVFSNSLSGALQIGSSGSSNSVRVENGGVLFGNVQVGRTADSVGNLLTVTGPGSRVQGPPNGGAMSVGYGGSASVLIVSNGATVLGFDGEMGRNTASSNNLALVTGSGSVWTNNHELAIGLNGSGNQLVVSNGGTVFTFANKYVGYNDGALANTAIVTDPGSRWLGSDSLYVGSAGSFNRLFVRNGAQVVSGIGTLGGIFGANSNQVLVTDAGSVWTNGFDVTVGENGSANTLVVSNGATLFGASDGFIGRNGGANSNTAIVTDLGTRWLLSSNLYVGSNGAFSQLVISNGARLENAFAAIGNNISSSNNEVLITGAGSTWSNRSSFHIGESGRANRLIVSDGGRVDCINTATINAEIGFNASSSNNQVIVTDPGSFFRVRDTLFVGSSSGGNRLVVSNGASLHDDNVHIGFFGTNNEVLVTGPGTTWTNRSGIQLGRFRGGNRLVISNSAFVFAREFFVSLDALSTNNRVVMHGGTLLVTNSTGVGALDVRRGTNEFNAGLIDVARLLVTNTLGQFEFNGGTLVSSGTAINNGRVFTVGNGLSLATFVLRNGTHSFANNLVIATNASLVGTGPITGVLTVLSGGTISPGTSIGKIILSNSPVLQGTTIMELSKTGTTLTNDQIQVAGTLTYGGSLTVTNIDPDALAAGNRYALFSADSYAGSFSSITLPPVASGLSWTNKLAVDGSIAVVPFVPPPTTLTLQRSNNLLTVSWSTNASSYCLETTLNLAPPVAWQTVTSGITTNGAAFVFSLTNSPTIAKQFFRLAFPCSTAPAPVSLTLQLSNNVLTVSWPSNAFRLETSFNLAPPASWQTIIHGVTTNGPLRTFTFTNSTAITNQFFRLAFP